MNIKISAKIIYLTILLLLWVEFFNLKFYGFLPLDIKFIILVIYIFYGCIHFRFYNFSDIKHELTPLKMVVIGWFLSMIMAWLFYNQSILTSLVVYRYQYITLSIIAFLLIRPTEDELGNAFKIYSLIFVAAYFLIKNYPQFLAIDDEKMVRTLLHIEEDDFGITGRIAFCVGLLFYLKEYSLDFSLKKLLIVAALFMVLLLNHNRGSLLAVTPIVIWALFKNNSQYKLLIWTFILCAIFYFFYSTIDTWTSLIEETNEQVSDDGYARNKAFNYFLFEASPNILCYIFGNGLISAHTSTHLAYLQSLHIYNSDVGMVGYWNQYGILALVTYIYMCVKIILTKSSSLWAKMIACMVCFNPITQGYIAKQEGILIFVLVYYFYIENVKSNNYDDVCWFQ